MKFFVKDFFANLQAGVVIYGMKVDDDSVYYGIENQPFPAYFPCICPNFFLPFL